MSYIKKMNATPQNRAAGMSAGAVTPTNYFATVLNNDKSSVKKKFSQTLTLEQLPHDDKYYLAKYGIDKVSYLAFMQANQFAYQVCYALEEAEYADPNYSPFYP